MKTILALFGFAWVGATGALAQSYSLDWFTVDRGGGTSTGGFYSLSGPMGQPNAGATMANGPYSVTGDFWALSPAVQNTGAPTLAIVAPAAPGQTTISWTPATAGFTS